MSHIIETEKLTVRFGRKTVLTDLDLQFAEGTTTAILGRNGVGKSTLLRVLVGYLPPTQGRAAVFGRDAWRDGPSNRARLGYVPDRLELASWMRVEDHLRFLEPFYPSWDRVEERRLLAQLELDPSAKVKDLSKGEREKHLLVAALAHRPSLLLLDEPFSGLDPVVRQQVLTAIVGHLRDEGRTILIVTHSMQDVERVADRIVLLDEGAVRLDGEADELRRRMRRISVTLRRGTSADWRPPGAPSVDRQRDDVVLSYLAWDDRFEQALRDDPDIEGWRVLASGLEDMFRLAASASAGAGRESEAAKCAAS